MFSNMNIPRSITYSALTANNTNRKVTLEIPGSGCQQRQRDWCNWQWSTFHSLLIQARGGNFLCYFHIMHCYNNAIYEKNTENSWSSNGDCTTAAITTHQLLEAWATSPILWWVLLGQGHLRVTRENNASWTSAQQGGWKLISGDQPLC